MSETLAAVDVGTNSLHLVVARTTDGDRFEVIAREKEMVRLGSGSNDMAELAPDAVDRTIAALDRFRRIADSHGAPLRAVATSAVREARNREVLIARAASESGVEIEVVSGVEEARLIHLGVLQALEVYDKRLLLFDIGGGSTEVLLGHQGMVLASTSIKVGAVRLTNRFFGGRVLHPSAVDSCRRHVEEMLSSFERAVDRNGFEVAVGSSGTIEQVLRIARALEGKERVRTLNGAVLTRNQVAVVLEAAIAARRDGTTDGLPDLDSKRSDILLAGALVLEGVVRTFGIEQVTFSDYALREGVFLDTIARRRGGTMPRLQDVARRSVVDLMSSCDDDPAHSVHVAGLAMQLFDAVGDRIGLDVDARPLLEAAALLANVGLVISHAQHHKHSYYLIRNSDRLVGLTDGEIELIAQIARYHRKGSPKASHAEWSGLPDELRHLVKASAAILRVAIGLDRAHGRLVAGITVEDQNGCLHVVARPATPTADLALDLYAATERSGLLAEVLGIDVQVVGGAPDD